jgi:hypothetical protein
MATFASLSQPIQTAIQTLTDSTLRPRLAYSFKNFAQLQILLAAVVASPTGLASTFALPAADSILAILQGLQAGEVVPVLNSGFVGAQSLPAALIVQFLNNINAVLTANFTPAMLQAATIACGSTNLD